MVMSVIDSTKGDLRKCVNAWWGACRYIGTLSTKTGLNSSLCPHAQHWPGTEQGLLMTMCPQPMHIGPKTSFPVQECFSRATDRKGEEEVPQGRAGSLEEGWKRNLYVLETPTVWVR